MFEAGMTILGIAIGLSTALTFGLRFRAERLRLKLLKTQAAEQPLRHAILEAQHDALSNRATRGSVPGVSLLQRAMATDPVIDDPAWESLMQFVDQQ
ncbi:hypothetical protein TFLX_06074 [Thermoflexales bacterium]|nr:hypothetical protein TFLX_06074 [Thermoflexales bacterium]